MKRVLKFLIVILVLALLLGVSAWYLLIYNPLILHNFLLQQARSFAASGDYTIASWCYEQVAKLSDKTESPELAIELADSYLTSGNYTKAEYTLTMAIYRQPTTELYLRLSQVYVAQDKLLDANRLIEDLADPEIQAELEAMRPAAPTADPIPGFYDTYITVAVSGDGGTLYVTDDGTYPSTWKEPYSQPYELPGGQTTLLAMTVGDNGLVSPLVTLEYTVVGVIEPVTFADPAFEAAVRDMLGIPEDKVLFTNDLWQITNFEIPAESTTVEDLAKLIYLENLTASHMDFVDSAVFPELTSLQNVTLSGCDLGSSTLEQLAALPKLTKLTMQECSLSNIRALSTAKGLTWLDLSGNAIRDIDAISVLSNLEHLDLNHNALTSVAGVAGLSRLQYLDVSFNSLSSIAPLSTCPELTYLDVSHNEIITLSALDQMPKLTEFRAAYNSIESVELIAGCTKLTKLDLSYNALFDVSTLSTLVELTEFDFSHNQVVDVPKFPVDCALISINGEYNMLASLEPLADLHNLNYVYMDYNEGITSVNALANCPKLVQVNVYGTGVTDVSALTAHSIIVNYNPAQ